MWFPPGLVALVLATLAISTVVASGVTRHVALLSHIEQVRRSSQVLGLDWKLQGYDNWPVKYVSLSRQTSEIQAIVAAYVALEHVNARDDSVVGQVRSSRLNP
jgi:hypothetical protein